LEQARSKSTLMLIAATCLIGMALGSALTLALTQHSQSIPTSGMIMGVGVGVYSDSACSQNVTGISWGTVRQGDSVNRTVYVKNTGNSQIALSMASSGWNPPAASGQIAVSWDREGSSLGAGQSAPQQLFSQFRRASWVFRISVLTWLSRGAANRGCRDCIGDPRESKPHRG
jgi:hypothetical protein